MSGVALTATVSGIDGFLWLIAVLAFLVAAIVAWFFPGHRVWAFAVSLGLLFAALTHLVH